MLAESLKNLLCQLSKHFKPSIADLNCFSIVDLAPYHLSAYHTLFQIKIFVHKLFSYFRDFLKMASMTPNGLNDLNWLPFIVVEFLNKKSF